MKKNFPVAIVTLVLFSISIISVLSLVGCNKTVDKSYVTQDEINRAKNIATDYMKLDNSLTSKTSYQENLPKIKNISTSDFYSLYYGEMEAMQTGLPDTTEDYKCNVIESSCEYDTTTQQYKVIILADESFSGNTYSYTSVIQVSIDFLISGNNKFVHNYYN